MIAIFNFYKGIFTKVDNFIIIINNNSNNLSNSCENKYISSIKIYCYNL